MPLWIIGTLAGICYAFAIGYTLGGSFASDPNIIVIICVTLIAVSICIIISSLILSWYDGNVSPHNYICGPHCWIQFLQFMGLVFYFLGVGVGIGGIFYNDTVYLTCYILGVFLYVVYIILKEMRNEKCCCCFRVTPVREDSEDSPQEVV